MTSCAFGKLRQGIKYRLEDCRGNSQMVAVYRADGDIDAAGGQHTPK